MSRWSWHERHGVVKGPVERRSDVLKLTDQEREERYQRDREYNYFNHQPPSPLFEEFRVCSYCSRKDRQEAMRWTGRRWLCPVCFDAQVTE